MCRSLGEPSSRAGSQSKCWDPETVSIAASWDIFNLVGLLLWNTQRTPLRRRPTQNHTRHQYSKAERKLVSPTSTTVSGVSQNQCTPPPPPSAYSLVPALRLMHFPGPPTRSCLEEQSMGCPSVAWPAKEQISSCTPNQTTRGSVQHTAHSILPLCWGRQGHWAMFWEYHKVAAQLLSLCVCPPPPPPTSFISPSLSHTAVFSASPPSLTAPLLSWVRASWACYPNPTVVVAFVSLTRGPALYTCQGANESNKQGPGKRGGQASAVLSSFTGFLAAALPWKLGNPQSASLMSDDARALMEKHTSKKK